MRAGSSVKPHLKAFCRSAVESENHVVLVDSVALLSVEKDG